jgi:flagellar basal body-associated protein FliL
MAEEPKKAKPSSVGMIIALVLVLLLGVGGALAAYKLLVAPRLPKTNGSTNANGKATTEDKTATPPEEGVGKDSETIPFDDMFVNVIMPQPDMKASTFIFKVSLECSDKIAAELVKKHKARFSDMLLKLHSFHTREELNDPLLRENIQKQALQQSNEILTKLQEKPDPKARVTAVLHERFAVQD